MPRTLTAPLRGSVSRRLLIAVLSVAVAAPGCGWWEDLSDASPTPVDPDVSRPVFGGDFPDPTVIEVDDSYYAYATQGSSGLIQMARSDDLQSWELLPQGALEQVPGWSEPLSVWAPAIVEVEGHYVIYYAALLEDTEIHCISRAVADDPEGPFVDDSVEPIVCPLYLGGAIDPSPVRNRDGSLWLLWKNDGVTSEAESGIWIQPLDEDGLSTSGDPVALIRTDQPWERPHIEAPSMLDLGDSWLLAYSANWWNQPEYGVGVAICGSLTGPCRKPLDGPVLASRPDAAGPGGAEFFRDAEGRPWVAYHAWLGGEVGFPSRRGLWVARVDPSAEPGRIIVGP